MPFRQRKAFRYRVDNSIRSAMRVILRSIIPQHRDQRPEFESISKILIVRASFRLGDSMFAVPAVLAFRKGYPTATIDFVGAPLSKALFKDLPIDHHFTLTRRFPDSSWYYPRLFRRLRSMHYDLAVDVSCSQSGMGAVLVGVSGARLRIGMRGKWDHWFNVAVPKSPERNKYVALEHFLQSLGLEYPSTVPWLPISALDKAKAKQKIDQLRQNGPTRPTVGVFVGGRKTWDKRWPVINFCQLIVALSAEAVNVIVFTGPEEKDLRIQYRTLLNPGPPVVFETSLTDFAAMLSNCDLFVTCDSGPMHLAYSLGIRTVAIFLHNTFGHWAPPARLCRVVYTSTGTTPENVLTACREELSVLPREGKQSNVSEPAMSHTA